MKRRRVDPAKAREAVMWQGWYESVSTPEKIICSQCGEERNSVGQEDGICLRCRWKLRAEARAYVGGYDNPAMVAFYKSAAFHFISAMDLKTLMREGDAEEILTRWDHEDDKEPVGNA